MVKQQKLKQQTSNTNRDTFGFDEPNFGSGSITQLEEELMLNKSLVE